MDFNATLKRILKSAFLSVSQVVLFIGGLYSFIMSFIFLDENILIFLLLMSVAFIALVSAMVLGDKSKDKVQTAPSNASKSNSGSGCLIGLIILMLVLFGIYWLLIGNWQEKTEIREKLFSEVSEKIMIFRKDNGVYPKALDELIPDYIDRIPDEINPNNNRNWDIKYSVSNCDEQELTCDVFFHYQHLGGPDSSAIYDVKLRKAFYEDTQEWIDRFVCGDGSC